MLEIPWFASRFQPYGFQWMTTMPGKFSPTLVWEFYITYKGELMRQYPLGNLQKYGDPITSMTIHGVQVNISLNIISIFLHGTGFQPPRNIAEIKYCIDEIHKNTTKQIELVDKIMHFRRIANIIFKNREEASWVICGQE